MHKLLALAALLMIAGCQSKPRDLRTVVFLIESSPANLDPRVGTDAQSEHIDELMFDGLVARDASFHFTPALAERWEQPDPKTLIFHLRDGVRFHDGRAMTARDVVWTINSMRNGAVISPKAAAYASVNTLEALDARTAVFHLKQADNFLLTNLSTGAMGIVPEGSGREFWRHPVGTLPVLAKRPDLRVDDAPGTQIQYRAFNTQDALLKDARVRQAISCAIDRNLIIQSLMGGHAQPAQSML